MTGDDTDRRAAALADVLLEFLFTEDRCEAGGSKTDDEMREQATGEAYWVLLSLDDPAGELGYWHVEEQKTGLEAAIWHLRQAEAALDGLAPPVQVAVSRNTAIRHSLAIPLRDLEALAARKVRVEDTTDFVRPPAIGRLVQDASDLTDEITVRIAAPSCVLTLIKQIRKALQEAKPSIVRVIEQSRTRPAATRGDPGKRGPRLDDRSWSAVSAYQQLRGLWEKSRGQPPARYPKDGDPFYRFAERGFEALAIDGINGRERPSVRSVSERVAELERKERPDSELEEK